MLEAVPVLLDYEEFNQWGGRPHPCRGLADVLPALQPLPRLHDIPWVSAIPRPVLQREKVHGRQPFYLDISVLRGQDVFPAGKRHRQPSTDPQERVLKHALCVGKRRASGSLLPAGLLPPPQLLMVRAY